MGGVADHVEVGETFDALVLKHVEDRRTLVVSIRQLNPDPYEVHKRALFEGALCKGRVSRVTDYGLFVELFTAVEGLVHINDLEPLLGSGDHPRAAASVGDELLVRVVSIERDSRRVRLGLPAL